MSAGFKVGDVCVFQNARKCIERNGMEVTVMAVNHPGFDNNLELFHGYLLDQPTPWNAEWVAHPDQLRKKHPPRSAKSIMREVIAKAKRPCEVPA